MKVDYIYIIHLLISYLVQPKIIAYIPLPHFSSHLPWKVLKKQKEKRKWKTCIIPIFDIDPRKDKSELKHVDMVDLEACS